MITYRKVGGLHFIKLFGRVQISFCRLSVKRSLDHSIHQARQTHAPVTYVRTKTDEWFFAGDVEPRHVCPSDSQAENSVRSDFEANDHLPAYAAFLDSATRDFTQSINSRITRFLSSPAMREAREIEGVLIGLICIPVVLIWSVMLAELWARYY